MHRLKQLYQAVIRLAKLAGGLPQTIAQALRQHRLQSARAEREVERLDRIRNPSKYRGKDC